MHGKEKNMNNRQEHICDAPTQALVALNSCEELGYFELTGKKACQLISELEDIAELGYVFNPEKGKHGGWEKLPAVLWKMGQNKISPQTAETKISKIMFGLRKLL